MVPASFHGIKNPLPCHSIMNIIKPTSMKPIRLRNFPQYVLPLMLAALLLSGCEDDPTRVDYSTVPPPFDTTEAVETVHTPGGMTVYIIKETDLPFEAVSRDLVDLFYTARSMDDQRVFDSSYANGSEQPATLQNLSPVSKIIGGRTVSPLIEGFRKGIIGVEANDQTILRGMREGEKRTLIIPPSMAYGDAEEGENGYNLRNDTLRFDIELDRIY